MFRENWIMFGRSAVQFCYNLLFMLLKSAKTRSATGCKATYYLTVNLQEFVM
jgi:hypothetical protein